MKDTFSQIGDADLDSHLGEKSQDHVSITGLRTITVNWVAGSPGDYIRVLTEFSPGATFELPD